MTDTATKARPDFSLGGRINMAAMAPFLALALLLVAGTFTNDNFLTVGNLVNVITRSAFIAIVAVGGTFVISAGGLDLSVGSMTAFVASLMIMFLNSGVIGNSVTMLIAAMALAIVLGGLCGLFNGLIVTVGKIEPFIATLGTMGIFRGLTTWLSQGGAITLRSMDIQSLYRPAYFGSLFGVPIPIIVIFATAALGAFIFYRTPYGRHVVAVGSNEDVARYSGIPVNRVRTITYVIQGLCVAIAVLLYVPRLGLDLGDHGHAVGVAGDHRRGRRRNGAARRRRAHLGNHRRSVHSRDRRQHHAAVQLHQRVPDRRDPGRDHHHRDAGPAVADASITELPGQLGRPARERNRP